MEMLNIFKYLNITRVGGVMEESELSLECEICFECKPLKDISFLPCIHYLCNDCYMCLKKNECPFCRNVLSNDDDSDFKDEENEYNDTNFEILVLESDSSNRRKRRKRREEKKIMRIINNSREEYIIYTGNSFQALDS